jgi:hypothetical protein
MRAITSLSMDWSCSTHFFSQSQADTFSGSRRKTQRNADFPVTKSAFPMERTANSSASSVVGILFFDAIFLPSLSPE